MKIPFIILVNFPEEGNFEIKKETLPRAQQTRGLSSAYQRNFLRLHHKFLFCIDQIFLFPRGRNFEVNKKESLSTRRVLKSSCENLNHLIVEQCIGGDLPSSPGRRLSLLQRGRNAK